MLEFIYSYLWGDEIIPDENQVRLRHTLMNQIKMSKLRLRPTNDTTPIYRL